MNSQFNFIWYLFAIEKYVYMKILTVIYFVYDERIAVRNSFAFQWKDK